MASWLRSAIFQIGLILSIGVWGLVSLLTYPFPYRFRYWVITRWARWAQYWLTLAVGVRVEVNGLANMPAHGGVVMCKHQSAWETIALLGWFSPQTWVLKRELLWVPLLGWALALLEPIAINRSAGRGAVRQVVAQGRQRLQAGRWVVLFPEGTRVPAGRKGRYHVGGAVLACAAGASVVPIAHNAGEVWPRASFRIRPGTVNVHIGPVINAAEYKPEALMRQVEAWIEGQMPHVSNNGYTGMPYERGGKARKQPS